MSLRRLYILTIAIIAAITAKAGEETDTVCVAPEPVVVTMDTDDIIDVSLIELPSSLPPAGLSLDTAFSGAMRSDAYRKLSLYQLPYSGSLNLPDWHRMWINTAVLCGAYIGTLFVLECLPEDATSWNRAALQKEPLFDRWWDHVVKKGPEWDHDNPIFNYVLHPYAGAAYFMAARSCGFSFWGSLLYSACISTIGWEFGIEAFMERPSIQDIFVTPIVGSALGELFYIAKRHIVAHDYHLLGSRFLGGFVCFLLDPVNEVVDLFRGSKTRALHMEKRAKSFESQLVPSVMGGAAGFTLTCRF